VVVVVEEGVVVVIGVVAVVADAVVEELMGWVRSGKGDGDGGGRDGVVTVLGGIIGDC